MTMTDETTTKRTNTITTADAADLLEVSSRTYLKIAARNGLSPRRTEGGRHYWQRGDVTRLRTTFLRESRSGSIRSGSNRRATN